MAKIGAREPIFAKIIDEPAGEFPEYEPNGIATIGKLVSANVTPSLATGELYADDELAEEETEFTSASISMETDDIDDNVASLIYGANAEGGEVRYNKDDAPPAGGLCYFATMSRNKKKFFRGYYFPLVKAALGNDNVATRGSSITFQTSTTTLTVFACKTGDWKLTHETDDIDEVRAWCREKLTAAPDA